MSEPRKAMLQHAAELITGDRNKTYGSPTQNFTDTAKIWSIQLRGILKDGLEISPAQVAQLMMSLKLCRLIASPTPDTYTDIAGYAGCGFEVEGFGREEDSAVAVVNAGDPEPCREALYVDACGDYWTYLAGDLAECDDGWNYRYPGHSEWHPVGGWAGTIDHPWTRIS